MRVDDLDAVVSAKMSEFGLEAQLPKSVGNPFLEPHVGMIWTHPPAHGLQTVTIFPNGARSIPVRDQHDRPKSTDGADGLRKVYDDLIHPAGMLQ